MLIHLKSYFSLVNMVYGHRVTYTVKLCALFAICIVRSADGETIRHLAIAREVSSNSTNTTVHHWGYEQNTDESPPQDWGTQYPVCKGSRQSPIAIDKAQVQESPRLGPLQFQSYGSKPNNQTWTVVNNRHTVQFGATFDTKAQPTLRQGGLPADYAFTQFHFHWGNRLSRGSEHVINNRTYPLELHMVHRKVGENDSQAQNDSTGLAVLTVLFDVTSEPNSAKNLTSIIQALGKVTSPNSPVNITLEELSLEELLPPIGGFYRYLGSLTTPPCAEAVEWSVLDTTQLITQEQMQVFHTLRENDPGVPEIDIGDNFRPLQPLNGRVVEHYSAVVQSQSTDSTSTCSTVVQSNKGYKRIEAKTSLLFVSVLFSKLLFSVPH